MNQTILALTEIYRERVENAIQSLQKGSGILVLDNEERENEGDLIFPAQTITVPQMAMLIRECSGIVCLCITQNQANQLKLPWSLRPLQALIPQLYSAN